MRVVFLSTPDFGVPSLKALVEAGHDVVGVITQPDRPQGRRRELIPCAVKAAAADLGLRVYQFERVRNKEAVESIRALSPDILVTAAFGQILSEAILDIAPYGCVNVHGSLLPKYRGPAPIQWALINGERQSGITTMRTAVGIDTGDILLQSALDIGPDETAGELFARMAVLGAQTLVQTLDALLLKSVEPRPQSSREATYFPMLKKQDGELDLTQSARQVHNRVRGVTPWPGAYAVLRGGQIKVWKTAVLDDEYGVPGQAVVKDGRLILTCGQGAVELLEVQSAGKKRMSAQDFLRGNSLWLKERN